MKKVVFKIVLLLFISGIVFGQVSKRGTTAASFLNISQGARAAGMGSAFVAVADDQSAMYYNVAGINRLKDNGIMFDHTQWIADIGYNFVGANLHLGSYGTIGFSFTSSDIGDMKVTTIDEPMGTGEVFTVQDIAVSVAWAYSITEDFTIGFNPKVVYQGIWKMSDYAMAIDMGILYNTPFKGITLGMSITNFGSKMQLQGTSSTVLYDPDESTTGNNGRIPANLSTEAWDLPLGFKVGVAYHPLISDSHDLIFALDASHPNDNYESINVGGEYTFKGMFSVRGGYKSLFLDASEESYTFGAGFRQYLMGNINFKVDYAYGSFGRLTEIHKFSVGINF